MVCHSGSVYLKCCMFKNITVDEVISVKEPEGHYISYIHTNEKCRKSALSNNLEKIDGVTMYRFVYSKGHYIRQSGYFSRIVKCIKNG